MAEQHFKVAIFRLQQGQTSLFTFNELMEEVFRRPLEDRLVEINGTRHRLEHLEVTGGCVFVNFARLAYSGPGRADQHSEVEPINLTPIQQFTFETAMMFDSKNTLVFLESRNNGIREKGIVEYFKRTAIGNSDFELIPLLDEQAAERARRFKKINRFMMRVAVNRASTEARAAGIGVLKSLGRDYGADVMDVEFSVARPRRQSLDVGHIWGTIQEALSRNESEVEEIELSGRENEDGPAELIDILHQRQLRERTLEIDDNSRNVPYRSRWEALSAIRDEFVTNV